MDDAATEGSATSCSFRGRCSGTPVVLASFRAAGAGWHADETVCEWHVWDVLLDGDPDEYSGAKYLTFEPLDPSDPWLPPGDDATAHVYEQLGSSRGRDSYPGIDWDAWHPRRPAGFLRHSERYPAASARPRPTEPSPRWGRWALWTGTAAVLVTAAAWFLGSR